jgi:hypothetical protein
VLRKPDHYLHEKVVSENITLEQYVNSGISTELDNGQVRLISGSQAEITYLSRKDLDVAKDNLDKHFIAVGLMERFEESLILFKKLLGWKNIFYVKKNVTQDRPREGISKRVLEMIKKNNNLDMELYEYGKHMFEDILHLQGVNLGRLIFFGD